MFINMGEFLRNQFKNIGMAGAVVGGSLLLAGAVGEAESLLTKWKCQGLEEGSTWGQTLDVNDPRVKKLSSQELQFCRHKANTSAFIQGVKSIKTGKE